MKAFITQGGLQSLEEALFNYVPVVGIPFYGDQMNNVLKVQSKGLGLMVDHKSLEKDTFKNAILEVINNPKYSTLLIITSYLLELYLVYFRYRKNAERWAKLIKDEPLQGLEKAVWWTEYVLRHKDEDLSHLKGKAYEIPFYQYFLLDVLGFFAVVLASIFYLSYICVKKLCCRSTQKSVKQKVS